MLHLATSIDFWKKYFSGTKYILKNVTLKPSTIHLLMLTLKKKFANKLKQHIDAKQHTTLVVDAQLLLKKPSTYYNTVLVHRIFTKPSLKAFEHFMEGIGVGVTDGDDLVGNPNSVFLDVVNFVNRHQEGTMHADKIL